MRIAIVAEVFLPKIDGVVNRTMNLIRQLVDAGDEVLVICPQAPGITSCPVPFVEVPSFSFRPYPEYRIGLPDQRLADAVASFGPDVLHYVNPFAFGFRCCDLLARAGIRAPSVFSFHTLYGEFVKRYRVMKPLSRLLWWLTRDYHNRADLNLTVSTTMLQDLVGRGFERVRYWPPAVDATLFHPEARSAGMRSRLSGDRPDRPLLVTVSRLAPEKNVEFLADVLARLPGTCLAIVGDGPHRAALEARFAGLDVQFLGYLKGGDLAAAYASADAFVYASETETMGNVVLEAMACGCPVVAPRAGGIPSLVTHEETGLLYAPGAVDEAVRLTQRALAADDAGTQRCRAARQWAEARAWSDAVGHVRAVYQEAIAQVQRKHLGARPRWVAPTVMTGLVTAFRLIAPKNQG
jgi:glycosyltransferase involved in cell wall biosynthesis